MIIPTDSYLSREVDTTNQMKCVLILQVIYSPVKVALQPNQCHVIHDWEWCTYQLSMVIWGMVVIPTLSVIWFWYDENPWVVQGKWAIYTLWGSHIYAIFCRRLGYSYVSEFKYSRGNTGEIMRDWSTERGDGRSGVRRDHTINPLWKLQALVAKVIRSYSQFFRSGDSLTQMATLRIFELLWLMRKSHSRWKILIQEWTHTG